MLPLKWQYIFCAKPQVQSLTCLDKAFQFDLPFKYSKINHCLTVLYCKKMWFP